MSSVVKSEDVAASGPGAPAGAPVHDLLGIRPIGIDDWSDVRYVHGRSFRSIVRPHVAPDLVDAFTAFLDEPCYADQLRSSNLIGAWLDGKLVGTAGWRRASDQGQVAQIDGLFVLPLFTFIGIGSALLTHAESRARAAGCTTFTTMATSASMSFFERFGYVTGGHGASLTDKRQDTPVFLMRKQDRAAALDKGTGAEAWQRPAAPNEEDGLVFDVTRRQRAVVNGD